jgi:very-short-patch-repair endonuclease
MRRDPVFNEAQLWKLLRDRRLEGLKFRRQVPMGSYIADFVCFRHRLIVEADGPYYHDAERDRRRDHWLMGQGFRVLRFPNHQIETRPQEVLQAILKATAPRVPSPLAGEGVSEADG